jgi:hypothetical protein
MADSSILKPAQGFSWRTVMNRLLAWLLVGVLYISSTSMTAAPDDDPIAIVERAISMQGGAEAIAKARTAETKIRGVLQSEEGALPFEAVTLSQGDTQFKHVMVYSKAGHSYTQVQAYDGDEARIFIDGELRNLDEEVKIALRAQRYAYRLAHNLGQLKEKDYELSSLGESKVAGKPVLGIKVTAKDRPEVRLFFDKELGFLVKTEHKQYDLRSRDRPRPEILQEVYYHDYRLPDSSPADERVLKEAKIGVEGKDAVAYFKKLGEAASDRDKILDLIKKLGDESFEVREKATEDLIAIGAPAVPHVQEALKSDDVETKKRAERILQAIKPNEAVKPDLSGPIAAARQLAKKPAGAAEALLLYLPLATDESLKREIWAALSAVATVDGKPNPELVAALEDKDPVRKQAAAVALGKVPAPEGSKLYLDNVKIPTRVVVFRAGRQFQEWTVVDVAFLNKVNDRVFSAP